MEQVIWVEQLSRHHEVVARTRCAGPAVFIGRGYDNDVVIDDPHIAPRHLCIERDASGAITATDLGSKSGLYDDGRGRRLESLQLDGNTVVRIGNTYLRVRPAGFAVPPETAMPETRNEWILPVVLFGLLIAYSLAGEWLTETRPFRTIHYAVHALSLSLFVVVWTGGWAILSRIFAGAANFGRHLKVAVLLVFSTSVCVLLCSYGAFAVSLVAIDKFAYLFYWSLLGLFCFFHLRVMGPSRMPLKVGLGAAIALTAIAGQSMFIFGEDRTQSQFDYISELKPPIVRLIPPQPEKTFWGDVAATQKRLDEARKVPPSGD